MIRLAAGVRLLQHDDGRVTVCTGEQVLTFADPLIVEALRSQHLDDERLKEVVDLLLHAGIVVDETARRIAIAGTLDLEFIRRVFDSAGFDVSNQDAEFDLACTGDYLDLALAPRRATVPAKLMGPSFWCGPWLEPGSSPCFECLRLWLLTRQWQRLLADSDSGIRADARDGNAAILWAAGWIASLLKDPNLAKTLERAVLTYNTSSAAVDRHEVRPHRLCRHCSRHARGSSSLLPLHSHVTGLFRDVCVSDEQPGGMYQSKAALFAPLPLPGARPLQPPVVVAGAGGTRESAVEACIAEGVERTCAAFLGDEPLIRATQGDGRTLDVHRLTLFSDRRVQPGQMLMYREARSLLTGSARLVPAGCVHLWYPFSREPRYTITDSNGCAAGRTLEEAQWKALLELVERDALAIWWYNRLQPPEFIAAQDASVDYLRSRGRRLYFLDLTTDLKIPVVAALAPKLDGTSPYLASAAGRTMEDAARRAASELIQILYWSQNGNLTPEMASWLSEASQDVETYLNPLNGHDPVSVDASLAYCCDRLNDAGLDPYWIDLTRADLGVPVVRVVAEDLRHHGRRLAPGRLYDVPVRMGRLREPLRQEQMNPRACFL